LALLALGIGQGHEVITVSHTAGPTVAAILIVGAVPVLIDVEDETYCLDHEKLADAITVKTRAIIAVHLYGHPADMRAILDIANDIPVIEDCAQAQGASLNGKRVGSMGSAGCLSFYPTKNLGAIGDGGAVASNDVTVIDRLHQLRLYGWTKPQYATLAAGRCSRLDELQAAILSVKLGHLDAAIARRRAIAARYREAFVNLPLVLPTERIGSKHTYHLYVVRTRSRDELESALRNAGVASGRHYPWPIHQQPAFIAKVKIPYVLKTTERIAPEILSLPLYAAMTDSQTNIVIEAVQDFFG
jgi:dTDP-4-amino-4,6-dideoxygalactose transaminase